jgi:deoxyribonuclease IV
VGTIRRVRAGNGDQPFQRLIGPHLPLGGGLLKAADRAREVGATSIQIFTDNPTAWRRRQAPPPELPAFRRRLAEYGIGPLAIHAPYLINLCGGDPLFWERSIATLANELRVGALYGASFVNVHIGSHRGFGRAAGIERLAVGLRRVLEETADAAGPKLVLENGAGTGDGIGSGMEDLADILEAAERAGVPTERLGFCLDTAHLWGAGYDISQPTELDALLGWLDATIGPERLSMIHLNDARTFVGSRQDRHEHVGAGQIGSVGLRHLLLHPRLQQLPIYLETPGMDSGFDAVNMERVRMLMEDEPLPQLPPEAFELRGSGSRSAPPASDG